MNQTNENLEETEETIPEGKVSHHTLSKPTVGKTHEWKQYGQNLVCNSCESQHGFRLKMGQQLVGIDENGMPKIVQVY